MSNEADKKLSQTARDARDFALLVARAICRYPESVTIQVYETPHRITLAPRCLAEDGGRIIGSGGEVFRAFKRMVDLWARRAGTAQVVEMSSLKTPNGEQAATTKFHEQVRWNVESWRETMGTIADALLGEHGATVQGDGPVVLTFWVRPDAMTENEARDVAAVLDTIGRAIAMTLGGEVAVDVGRRKEALA